MPNTGDITQTFTSVSDGDWIDVGLDPIGSYQVSGTFTGTVEIQVSNRPDGSQVAHTLATLTSTGFAEVTVRPRWIRASCTAFTSGTITVDFHTVSG